jgi:hypothetical protein
MVALSIPETSRVQGFPDLITIAAGDGMPALSLSVKVYPGAVDGGWYLVLYAPNGTLLVPAKQLATSPNIWAAHTALLRSTYGRSVVCAVSGEPSSSAALFGQCSVDFAAESPLTAPLLELEPTTPQEIAAIRSV